VLLASVVTALVMGVLTLAPPQWAAVALMLVLGLGWIVALTTLNGVAQAVLPNWVRGRGLAIYLMVFNGAMALGSLGWGLIAGQLGLPVTLLIGPWAWCWCPWSFTASSCPPAKPICSRPTTGPSLCWPNPWPTTVVRS
jgi:MFS family permease